MKKILSLLLASAMSLSLLAGCGGAPQTPAQSSNPPASSSSSQNGSEPSAPAGPIKVAALSSGYIDAYPDMWKEVCQAFTAETGIEVTLTLEKNLEDVIGPSMQGGDYPDVVLLATGREKGLTEQFIKDKLIADITDVLSMTIPGESATVSSKLIPGFVGTNATNPYGDGKTYLAPMFYSPCGLFYNANLLNEKGWTVPTTWDEMWELGDKAKAEGIDLFTYPTTGYFDAFFYALMYSVGGADFFNQATSYAEGVWDTAEGQQCFDIVAKLAEYTAKVTPAQANESDFSQNQQLILDNKALFMPNGTWIVGEMADAPREDGDAFQWGMTALPAAKAGGAGASYAFLEQIWIPSGAQNVDAAKQFVAYMYSDDAADIFLKGGAVQPINGIVDKLEGDNVMFYSIYDNGANAVVGIFSAYASVAGLGTVREVFFDPVNGLVSGNVTKDQWIADIKAASDQMRENLV
ncbi:carbohydrate ABC transporter substrate-binding protein [Flintibacter muris]|uniref:carbohydrate ABC transporter substrate-binding protein n=1 Tax=Flintibacter muris TaxID=2941327 RepID=UPI00203AA622|nr:carbohydrate ABC transporter substrate-binding protein [Flintibacter muris]